MVKSEKTPFGYIYRATNIQNGKNYMGQTVTSRWGDDKNPIEERWKEEVREAYARQKRGENLRYIEKAIVKNGPENFEVKEQDVAYSQKELNEKENYWMREYDTLNPDKGYNVMEVGRGGQLTQQVKEKMSKSHEEKWQEDLEYQQKQLNERRERAKDPEWLEKMAEVNQEIARNPETLDKMSKSISAKWQEKEYQENVGKGVTRKWQEAKFRERQFNAKLHGRREIPDKREFLKEIQNLNKKVLNKKYDMDGKCINDRIEEMLGHHGIKNFSQAKKYLENKNLDNVLKDINEKLDNQTQKIVGKKEISNKREFLTDIQKLQKNEIDHKYRMDAKTANKKIEEILGDRGIKNYTEAKEFLKDKEVDDVLKDIEDRSAEKQEDNQISESKPEDSKKEPREEYEKESKDKGLTEGKTEEQSKEITDKPTEEEKEEKKDETLQERIEEPHDQPALDNQSSESSEEMSREQKFETSGVPREGSVQDLIGEKIREIEEEKSKRSSERGFIDYYDFPIYINDLFKSDWDQLGHTDTNSEKDYDGVDKSSDSISYISRDYEGIDETSSDGDRDFQGLDKESKEEREDFAGIDDYSSEGSKDYDAIDEEYSGGEHGGEA